MNQYFIFAFFNMKDIHDLLLHLNYRNSDVTRTRVLVTCDMDKSRKLKFITRKDTESPISPLEDYL